jgi:acyl dehydratase
MFYEDFRVAQSSDLGQATFSREAILAYGRRFDPRILARVKEGAPLAAPGLNVAAAGMRRLIDTRSATRAATAEGGESLPELGVSPGFKNLRWPRPVHGGRLSAIRCRPFRTARRPSRTGGGSPKRIR